MKYARVINNFVVEVFTPPVRFALEECFTPEIAAQFEPCPDAVGQNWLKLPDGTFAEPPAPVEPESPAV